MRIDGGWLASDETQLVLQMLEGAGHQAYVVGGCVRNAVLGAPIADVDITTDALPEMVMQLAASSGLKAVPTGVDHGTVTVIAAGVPYEVTTFRKDVETDGRHAVVAFSDNIRDDAMRRDLTMNALYARADGEVVDPLGGLPDLMARRVVFVGEPAARIQEDYLRILRFFRFHAWYGDPDGGIDAEGLAACAEHASGLKGLSKERVGSEILKLLSAPDPAPSTASMAQSGVLMRILPGATAQGLAPLVHFEQALGLQSDPIRRLAAMSVTDAEKALRLSRRQARQLAVLSEETGTGSPPNALAHQFGVAMALDVLALRSALLEMPLPEVDQARLAQIAKLKCPVTAHDLQPKFSGPALGAELKRLEQLWIASDFNLTKAELLG